MQINWLLFDICFHSKNWYTMSPCLQAKWGATFMNSHCMLCFPFITFAAKVNTYFLLCTVCVLMCSICLPDRLQRQELWPSYSLTYPLAHNRVPPGTQWEFINITWMNQWIKEAWLELGLNFGTKISQLWDQDFSTRPYIILGVKRLTNWSLLLSTSLRSNACFSLPAFWLHMVIFNGASFSSFFWYLSLFFCIWNSNSSISLFWLPTWAWPYLKGYKYLFSLVYFIPCSYGAPIFWNSECWIVSFSVNTC